MSDQTIRATLARSGLIRPTEASKQSTLRPRDQTQAIQARRAEMHLRTAKA